MCILWLKVQASTSRSQIISTCYEYMEKQIVRTDGDAAI
jgi:hypothetical protein